MATKNLDELVLQANEAAEKGDWQGAIAFLSKADGLSPNESGILSGLGACYLQLKRPEDAIRYFSRVVELESQLPDAFCNLGMAYSTAGQFKEAEDAFLKALLLDGSHIMTRKNLAVLYAKQNTRIGEGLQLLVNLLKDNPKDLEIVLMLASYYLLGEMYDPAEKLCQYALTLEPENPYALQMMDQIKANAGGAENSAPPAGPGQAPADDSSDVIDPTRIARPEHAKKLAALKDLGEQRSRQPDETRIARPEHAKKLAGLKGLSETKPEVEAASVIGGTKPSALFLGGNSYANFVRLQNPARLLSQMGWDVFITDKIPLSEANKYNIVVFSQPHLEPAWIDVFSSRTSNHNPVIIDVDEDFFTIPTQHVEYKLLGQGNPQALNGFKEMLGLADKVIVSSKVLEGRYQAYSKHVEYIPSIWSTHNTLWDKPAPRHKGFNIGWIEYASEIHNLDIVREELIRFIRDNKKALLVIAGDLKALEPFKKLPDDQKTFLPFTGIDDYPYLMSQFDALLMPLKKTAYNNAKPDTRLMEAGVRRIPWIASRIPSFEDWNVGGLFAGKSTWYESLKKIYLNEDLRIELGEAGRRKAEERLAAYVTTTFTDLVNNR